MSFDGLGADALAARSGLVSFGKIASEGTWVRRVIPVNPTQTSPTHVAILTGAPPEVNGIVANRFHLPGTPRDKVTQGMDTDIETETLVDAARRQGKRIGCILFPTIDGRTPRRSADWGLAFTRPLTKSRLVKLTRDDFREEWVPPTWTPRASRRASFSPVMRARLEWAVGTQNLTQDVDLVAYDTTDDRARNYDTFLIEISAVETAIAESGWFPISMRSDGALYGSWSKLLRRDASLGNVVLYMGAISTNDAYPAAFRNLLDEQAGFWPGAPDEDFAAEALAGGEGIDARTAAEQLLRLSDFLNRTTAVAMERMPFDLLLLYQPIVDAAEHQFLIVRDSQPHATPANRAAGELVRAAAFNAADRALGNVLSRLDPEHDALVVTGDHGLAPIDTELRINSLLAARGFAPRWTAFGNGNIANFYRFEDPDDTGALVNMLTASGYFERVERKSAASHRNSGDVIAYAHPNVSIFIGEGEITAPPRGYGQHGALNSHPELHTLLGAWGAGTKRLTTIDSIQQTEIAGYVARLLGITPPITLPATTPRAPAGSASAPRAVPPR